MIELSVFPKTFFGVEVPSEINDKVLDICKTLDYEYDSFPHPLTTNTNLHKSSNLDFYVKYLNSQIEEIKKRQELDCERLSISSMWANKYTENRMSHRHNHPMFWLSFIHYLTEGSSTTFYDHHSETPWMWMGESNPTQVSFKPGKNLPVGSILFFPSWVAHSVEEHIGEDRISIAGNIFPEGSINRVGNREYLNVKLST